MQDKRDNVFVAIEPDIWLQDVYQSISFLQTRNQSAKCNMARKSEQNY